MKKWMLLILTLTLLAAVPTQALAFDLSALGELAEALEGLSEETADSAESEATEAPSAFTGPLVEVDIGGKTVEVHEDFKTCMDEYEAFFDEYMELMTDEDADYVALLDAAVRYAESIEALDELEDAELSEGDMAYYLAASARIYAKLAEFE